MTLKEIGLWVGNDEGLYRWWRSTGLPRAEFVRANRGKLEEVISNILSGKKPSHYLTYGG